MLQINEAIEVDARPADVWAALADVRNTVNCIPGATLDEEIEDGLYAGHLALAFGPITATFDGQVKVQIDSAARVCTLDGRGVDRRQRNRTTAAATIRQTGTDEITKTSLIVDAQIEVSGPLSQFVNTGGAKLARVLLEEFGTALSAQISAGGVESGTPSPIIENSPLRLWSLLASLIRASWRRLKLRLSSQASS